MLEFRCLTLKHCLKLADAACTRALPDLCVRSVDFIGCEWIVKEEGFATRDSRETRSASFSDPSRPATATIRTHYCC